MWSMIWAGISALLLSIGPRIIARAAVALGISVVTYPLVDGVFDHIKTMIFMELQGLPSGVIQMLGLLRIDKAIQVVMSAYVFRYAFFKLTSSRLTFKTPGS